MDETRPAYYAVIPADVRYDDRIPANAKLLYGEISALIGADGFCYASNSYFADLYGCTTVSISRLISKLEQHRYIRREEVRDASGQIVQRKLYLSVSAPEEQPFNNIVNTPKQNCGEGINKNVKETNTSITVKKESKKKKTQKPEPVVLTDEQLDKIVIDGISEMAAPSWSREVKNQLYKLMIDFYRPDREVKRARPMRSETGVKRTFDKLKLYAEGDPIVMIDMLLTAISAGWQGVQCPNRIQKQAAKPVAEERQYKCV